MPAYIVVATLTGEGAQRLREDPARLSALNAEAERLGARILHQYATLGPYDFVTFVEAPDNVAVMSIATEISSLGTVRLHVYPAVAFDRFFDLMKAAPYRTEPHRWQTQWWARQVRRYGRYWVMTRHMRQLCRPLTVEGSERLAGLRGESIIIANHTSHIDTPTLLAALPSRIRERVAVAAAADRFYRRDKRGWYFSLFWNSYPIARGGGMAALQYSMWLLSHGWSILIYPEGGRFKAGEVQRFRHGPAILAMQAKVPVLPVYLEGLHALMPRGQRSPRPGPALVRFGAPLSLDGAASVPEATERLRSALLELAGLTPAHAEAAG